MVVPTEGSTGCCCRQRQQRRRQASERQSERTAAAAERTDTGTVTDTLEMHAVTVTAWLVLRACTPDECDCCVETPTQTHTHTQDLRDPAKLRQCRMEREKRVERKIGKVNGEHVAPCNGRDNEKVKGESRAEAARDE